MSQKTEQLTPMDQNPRNACFGCGPANQIGLRLEFSATESRSVVCITAIAPEFAGLPGYAHGGIIATLLDETMAKSVRARGFTTMTRHMEVEYLRPVPCSAQLRLEGRVTHNEGRKHWTEARILDEHGRVLALGKGLFIEVSPKRVATRSNAGGDAL